ncbi:hypothetical protein GCM10009069_16520 [Algimonas arctica]|uniref:DUF2946 domain-containing protein n=1 Tax=Algimonas arctica TaxID=1479486 RepID=A0A8J3CQF6_9PROT|nr:hypothetical protein [Algimonas arctica]GHA94086.1 hypothetical protein GCM10009069_16520 [Algimonas arctica]
MALGQMKALISIAVATLFGVMQIVCACLPAATSADLLPTSASSHTSHMAMSKAGMSAQSHGEHSAHGTSIMAMDMDDADRESRADDDHDHAMDCVHCDTDLTNASVSDIPTPSVVDVPQPELVFVMADPTPRYRAGMAATNLSGLRWRDPPRSTPVSLNTLALI